MENDGGLLLCGLVLGLIVGGWIAFGVTETNWWLDLQKKGLAQHSTQTGSWEFINGACLPSKTK